MRSPELAYGWTEVDISRRQYLCEVLFLAALIAPGCGGDTPRVGSISMPEEVARKARESSSIKIRTKRGSFKVDMR